MIAGYDFHRFFDQLVALFFQLLSIAVFASIHTATEVVVLRGWRWRTASSLVLLIDMEMFWYSPITIRGHDIVDPQFLADLLDTQVDNVGIKLLGGHGCGDSCRQIH